MDLKALKAKIAQLSYDVRSGDRSKAAERDALRLECRRLLGLPVLEPKVTPANVVEEAPIEQPLEEEVKEEASPVTEERKKRKKN